MTMTTKSRIEALSQHLRDSKTDAFLQPTQDAFLSEYPPESAKKLAWLTGFDGSAGAALILSEPVKGKPAVLFTDGRYTLQASQQLDAALFHIVDIAEDSPATWLQKHAPDIVMGYDAWIHAHRQVKGWAPQPVKAIDNPIDTIWKDRPEEPCAPVIDHPLNYAGQSREAKIEGIIQAMQPQADAVFLGMPDGINWLLNMRGSDIAFNPLVLCYALLRRDGGITLVTHPRKLPDGLEYVEQMDLATFRQQPSAFFEGLENVQIDPTVCVEAIWQALQHAGVNVIASDEPTLLPKAIKNDVEIEGMRAAHRRDGRALSAFLEWAHQKQTFAELEAAQRLEQFRMEETGDLYRGASFDTISGSGPNGAIVHYRVTPATDRTLNKGELYLVDSGAQYPDGTTDVTRTIVSGKPTYEMIDRYTRVLKGHIAIATAHFPVGTSGSQLDALARQYLWEIGEDYAHGTGHGVGSYLCVHEGPQRISKRAGDVALRAGMILSNEPGYYKNDEYGIRIENLVLVKASDKQGFLCFETLTLAPMEEALIDRNMLTEQEVVWLDAYHQQVAENNA